MKKQSIIKNTQKQDTKEITLNLKQGKTLQQIIPINFSNYHKINQIFNNENFVVKKSRDYEPPYEPFNIFPPWPKEEEIQEFNFDQQELKEELFSDPEENNIFFPDQEEVVIAWKRPSQYIHQYLIRNEIVTRFPLRNTGKLKKFVNEMYMENSCPLNEYITPDKKYKKKDEKMNVISKRHSDYTSDNKRILKSMFKIFDKNDYFVIKHFNSLDSKKEEKDISKDEESSYAEFHLEENILNSAAYKNSSKIQKERKFLPTALVFEESATIFNKWITSILQFIVEFEIEDEGEPIWKKIYPQKDGVPIYNPNGCYWIKLNHMGKPRKIEIDDKMPIDRNEEIIMPRCKNLEELWPALITKAIIKLFSYKFKYYTKPENIIGDIQIINSLTGYFSQNTKLSEVKNENYIKNLLDNLDVKNSNLIANENLNEKDNFFILCYNFKSAQDIKIEKKDNKRKITSQSNQLLPILELEKGIESSEKKEEDHKKPKKKINFIEKLKAKIREEKLEAQNEAIEAERKKEEKKIKERINTRRFTIFRDPFQIRNLMLQSDLLIKNQSNLLNIKQSLKKGELDHFNKIKLDTQIFIGFGYSIVEVINTENFNMKRTRSFDFNDLKSEMIQCKNIYKSLVKEERKRYIPKLVEISLQYKDIIERKLEDLKSFGKNQKLIKISNNCLNMPKFKIYSNFTNEEIELSLRCLVNNWEFPPYEYYEDLWLKNPENEKVNSHYHSINNHNDTKLEKDSKFANVNKINNSNENCEKIHLDMNIINNEIYDNSNFNSNNNIIKIDEYNNISNNNISKSKNDFNKIPPKKKSFLKSGTIYPILNLKKNPNFLSNFEEIFKITSQPYIMEFYLELINKKIELYNNEKKAYRKEINGQYITYSDLLNNFNNYLMIYKNPNLRIKKNFDMNWDYYKSDLYNSDKENRVFLISINKDYLSKELNNLSSNNQNSENASKSTPKNAGNANANRKEKEPVVDLVKLAEEEKLIKLIKEINSYPKDKKISILIEFSPNNGNYLEEIELNFYIIFDLVEIKQSTKTLNFIENDSGSKNSITYLKPVEENITLKGFYDIFDKNILEQNKNYLFVVKSCFCPFGYNLNISTEFGNIENINYEKYLITYGDMKLVNNYRIPIPNLFEDSEYLLAKICVKFNKKNSLKFLKIKFNITIAQDYFILQYVDLYIQRIKFDENEKELKAEKPKKLIVSDILNLNLSDFKENDEIIFILIMKTPFDINQGILFFEILSSNVTDVDFVLIDMVKPYEISDDVFLDKQNILFKEIFYVPEKTYATLNFSINKIEENENDNISPNFMRENKTNSSNDDSNSKTYSQDTHNHFDTEKNIKKFRYKIKIFKKTLKIFETDFFDNLLIQNIILEGVLIPQEIKDAIKNKGKNPTEEIEITKESPIQYRLECLLDNSENYENPIKPQSKFNWKIEVFCSENIGFVKDTLKEDHEKELIKDWETSQPGRSLRAKETRVKYIENLKQNYEKYVTLKTFNTNMSHKSKFSNSTNFKHTIRNLNNQNVNMFTLKSESSSITDDDDNNNKILQNDLPNDFDKKNTNANFFDNVNILDKIYKSNENNVNKDSINKNNINTNEFFKGNSDNFYKENLKNFDIESNIRKTNIKNQTIFSNKLDTDSNNNYFYNINSNTITNANKTNFGFRKEANRSLNQPINPFILKELKIKNEKEFFNLPKINPYSTSSSKFPCGIKLEPKGIRNNNNLFFNPGLNEKLKTASEYYRSYCISKADNKFASFNTTNEDNKSKFGENKSHVSTYINKFMDETYEIPNLEGKLDKDKECRIQFKRNIEDDFSSTNTNSNQKFIKLSKHKKTEFNTTGGFIDKTAKLKLMKNIIMNNEKEKDISFHSKYLTKHNFIKNEKSEIFEMRDSFMNSFNEKREKENALFDLLNSAKFENSQIEACVDSYKNLMKNMSGFPMNNKMKEIHKLISVRKEKFYCGVIGANGVINNNKEQFMEYLIDVRKNKWSISKDVLKEISDKAK